MKVKNLLKQLFSGKNEIAATAMFDPEIDTITVKEQKFIDQHRANTIFIESDKMIEEYLKEDVLNLFSNAPLILKTSFMIHAFELTILLERMAITG